MSLIRAVIVGGVAAVGLPTLFLTLQGGVGHFLRSTSHPLLVGSVELRWSPLIFAIVALFCFVIMAWTRNR